MVSISSQKKSRPIHKKRRKTLKFNIEPHIYIYMMQKSKVRNKKKKKV